MKNDGTPIAIEGVPFLLVFLLAALAFSVGKVWWAAIPCFLLSVYTVFFFRNPERLAVIGSDLITSAADGRVIYVGEAMESHFLKSERKKISIFMSLFDVHINRIPIDGTVRNIQYKKGRFWAANEERACAENEQNAILLETQQGDEVVVVQIAGLIARRIVSYPKIGIYVMKGQRFGLIRFGSRCDLYLPKSAEILVNPGDKVLGGETVVARIPTTGTLRSEGESETV